jgi:hypothetical protein
MECDGKDFISGCSLLYEFRIRRGNDYKKSGSINEAEYKRRASLKAKEQKVHSIPKQKSSSLSPNRTERLTQRTVKFIRWLKSHLDIDRNWDESAARLQQIYSRS